MHKRRTDYHIHPNYSIDASPATMHDYCLKAVELGLSEICFTTHVELDPVRHHLENFVNIDGKRVPVHEKGWLDKYFGELREVQEKFNGKGLKIKAGVEIGFCPGVEKEIEKLINNYPFDYILGAIHCLNHISISSKKESPEYFRHNNVSQMAEEYFNILKEAVQSELFDCIAHVDLYRRYGYRFYGDAVLTVHRGRIEPIFEEMAQMGMGLEINTSSIRRGLKEFHPTKEILALAAGCGIKIYTIGSDAHSPEELGGGIDEALELLKEYQLHNYLYDQRKPYPCT